MAVKNYNFRRYIYFPKKQILYLAHNQNNNTLSWREQIIMKATGIVRRIDDLGRVVIPKEIRRNLRIREGDPLEIFVDRDG